jgi:MoaA/NifB/PqqE/SkfB family radical SAM enzyme
MTKTIAVSEREKNKERNFKEREQGSLVISSMPLVAKIEITTRCNLACRMCATSFSDRKRADLSFETFKKLEPLFPFLLSAYLYGIGEPLLHPDLQNMIDVLICAGVNTGIITNGILITEQRARTWVQDGLYKISISIDGATQETYETIRRGSSFKTLCNNIAIINKYKRDHRSERPYLTFNFVTMRSNVHELPALVEMAAEHNVHEVIVSDLLVFDESVRDEKLLFSDELLQQSFRAAEEKAQALGVSLILPNTFLSWRESCNKPGKETKEEQVNKEALFESFAHCTEPWSSFWFSQEGEVTPCCYWFRKMGNINQTDFATIWNNQNYRSLRAAVNSSSRPQQCRHCPIP